MKTLSNKKPSQITEYTYLYDGWNMIAEFKNGQFDVTHYIWNLDISGTPQGAGGVGGLVAVCKGGEWYIPLYDANGNITEYVNTNGVVVARYDYDAFGRTVSMYGTMANEFKYRFSTKYYDDETGFYYYGYRYYFPEWGRWLNRDPIEEEGGMNLYGFCGNDGVNSVDYLGQNGAIAGAVCALHQYFATQSRYDGSSTDKFKHCWASCQISRNCGVDIAEILGLQKEIRDRMVSAYCKMFDPENKKFPCDRGQGDFWDSLGDLMANQQCMDFGSYWSSSIGGMSGVGVVYNFIRNACLNRDSCEDCCERKVGRTREPK